MKSARKSLSMFAIVGLFLLCTPLFALPSLSWREEFTDNGDKWTVGETGDYKFEIVNGVYSLTGKTGVGTMM